MRELILGPKCLYFLSLPAQNMTLNYTHLNTNALTGTQSYSSGDPWNISVLFYSRTAALLICAYYILFFPLLCRDPLLPEKKVQNLSLGLYLFKR